MDMDQIPTCPNKGTASSTSGAAQGSLWCQASMEALECDEGILLGKMCVTHSSWLGSCLRAMLLMVSTDEQGNLDGM